MGLSVPTSRIVPCQSEPLGKPRLTLVSDGNPSRRLLLRSKKNSGSMAVSPWMDLPVTSRRGNCLPDLSVSGAASRWRAAWSTALNPVPRPYTEVFRSYSVRSGGHFAGVFSALPMRRAIVASGFLGRTGSVGPPGIPRRPPAGCTSLG